MQEIRSIKLYKKNFVNQIEKKKINYFAPSCSTVSIIKVILKLISKIIEIFIFIT